MPRRGDVDGAERGLRASFDRESLAVYADALLGANDPRGELCAIDLSITDWKTPPDRYADMTARRAELVTKLVGKFAADPAIDTTFGFLKVTSATRLAVLDSILCSTLGPFVRDVVLEGTGDSITQALTTLALSTRPWLTRLVVRQSNYSGDGNVPQAIVERVIAASPNLVELAVSGHKLFARFPHPNVARLEITGVHAIGALATTKQGGMPGVVALDYRFMIGNTMPTFDRRRVMTPAHFPAVTQLDLTRNPLAQPLSEFELFRFLRTLPIAPQLQRLCLPQIVDDDQLANAQTLLDRIPDLRELVLVTCERARKLEHRRAKIELR